MANRVFTLGLALGLVMAFGAAAQPDYRPADDTAKPPLAREKADTAEPARKPQTERQHTDISTDPDRSAIGPRTTQGLAQDAISRSNSR